ncbi:cysteine hydrolase family protein [Roseateles violae]|uniref:Cysteine hydrolase n=1 Tax=Roseateles violae TaxID=3058042 RepID=A0ABT8DPM6_9BURK|nr:cysteine hydrolase [Pelomonas sp. PFR6]MDN3920290.1 cysteine hydrolase [Pelomonas sp. PFR6]
MNRIPNPRHSALLIVDLQNDFLAPDGAYARGGAVSAAALQLPQRVAPVAQAFKQAGGLVVCSRFTLWPNARGEPMVSSHLKALRPFLKRGDFSPGSSGHAVVPPLEPHVDVSVDKVAYSAFFNTQLEWVLRRAGVEAVFVCGIVTNGGVASTVRDAHARDFDTYVLCDGCAAFNDDAHRAALKDIETVAAVIRCTDATDMMHCSG